jgi:hypothetical protein
MEDAGGDRRLFETKMPSEETRPLFDAAPDWGRFYLGMRKTGDGEGDIRRFNTSILVGPDGAILGKYRKIHLPGHASMSRGGRSSIWKSAISKAAISAFRWPRPLAEESACASATTAAGRRRSGCSAWAKGGARAAGLQHAGPLPAGAGT